MILTLYTITPNSPEKRISFLMITYIIKIGFSYTKMKISLFSDLVAVMMLTVLLSSCT